MGFQPGQNFDFSYRRQLVSRIFFLLGCLLMGIYFLFQFTIHEESSPYRIYLIDNSSSMAVKDAQGENGKISRLDLTKEFILQDDFAGNKGIITFARVPYIQLPATSDMLLFKNIVKNMGIVSGAGGSDFVTAISEINALYSSQEVQIIFMSDGETFDDSSLSENLSKSIDWVVVGVGTPSGGAIVESYQSDGSPHYKQYQGEKVVSKLDEKNLKNIAKNLSSEYIHLDSIKNIENVNLPLPKGASLSPFTLQDLLVIFGILSIMISYFILPYKYHKYD